MSGHLLVPKTTIIVRNNTGSVEVTVEFPNHTLESDEEFHNALNRSIASLRNTLRQARHRYKKALDENAEGK